MSTFSIYLTVNKLECEDCGKKSTRHKILIQHKQSNMFQGPSAPILRDITTDENTNLQKILKFHNFTFHIIA